jgi:hypothetical protein
MRFSLLTTLLAAPFFATMAAAEARDRFSHCPIDEDFKSLPGRDRHLQRQLSVVLDEAAIEGAPGTIAATRTGRFPSVKQV